MKNVINDTLNISKNSALEVETIPCRVQDLLTSVQAMFRSDLIDKGIQVSPSTSVYRRFLKLPSLRHKCYPALPIFL